MSNEYAKTERTSLKMRLRSCALKVAAFLARLKPAILPSQLESEAKTGQSLSISAQLAEAHALIDMAANNGVVPDAHVLSLYDCHVAGLAETRRQLGEAEAGYQSSLRRLDAMFPKPPAPLPEPPVPAPPKFYPRLSSLFGGNGKSNPLH